MIIALLICEIIFFILFMIDYAKLEKKFDELKKENETLKEENNKLKERIFIIKSKKPKQENNNTMEYERLIADIEISCKENKILGELCHMIYDAFQTAENQLKDLPIRRSKEFYDIMTKNMKEANK